MWFGLLSRRRGRGIVSENLREEKYMKVRDLIEECRNRPTKSLCDTCPYKEKCEFLKDKIADACPCSYFEILEGNI